MECDDRPGGGGLAEGDVVDGAGPAEDADAPLAAPGEGADGVHDVGSAGDLKHVGTERVGAVSGDDDGWFGLVLGPGGAAAWSPRHAS